MFRGHVTIANTLVHEVAPPGCLRMFCCFHQIIETCERLEYESVNLLAMRIVFVQFVDGKRGRALPRHAFQRPPRGEVLERVVLPRRQHVVQSPSQFGLNVGVGAGTRLSVVVIDRRGVERLAKDEIVSCRHGWHDHLGGGRTERPGRVLMALK